MKRGYKLFFGLLSTLLLTLSSCGKSPQESTFKLARVWDRTGIRNHYNSGSNIGALGWLSVEPLVQYVRTTDELHYLLAESIVHNDDHTSLINLRKNAKWHNGDDFTAKDVLAYYSMNFTTLSNYLSKFLEEVDQYTVKLTWKEWMEPNDSTKTLMIAQDKVGSVPYNVFTKFCNKAQQILSTQTACEVGYLGWAPYGKKNDSTSDTAYTANYKAFSNTNPDVFCGTGPYKLKTMNQTQMLLKKNENYYLKEKIPFDNIVAYNLSDLSTIYNKLSAGELDYQDGFAPDNIINSILESNNNMVHLKAYDPASVGILFNLEKTNIWTDKVREAFQYLFDREEMKNAANRYAYASYYPVSGIVSTEAKKFMKEEDFSAIPQFSHNEEKAISLLQEAGWNKIDNKWFMGEEEVRLTLGYDGSNAIMSSMAEAVQGALKRFGINCVLKRAADWGTWFTIASDTNSYYDFTINWTELGLSFAHPTGCYQFFFNDQNGPILHLPKLTQEDLNNYGIPGYELGNVNLYLDKHDGSGKFHAYQYLSRMYSMNDEELKTATADLVYGVGALNYGVNLMQNVSGGFYNSKVIKNLPLESYWGNGSRNVTFIPEMFSNDYYALARCSLEFSAASALLFQYSGE